LISGTVVAAHLITSRELPTFESATTPTRVIE
jgi:hypothetical protein